MSSPNAEVATRIWSVLTNRMPSGEHLPVLINYATGVPAELPLRWAIDRRHRTGSKTLRTKLSAIADLYEWLTAVRGMDPDRFFRAGKVLSEQALRVALAAADVHGSGTIAGVIRNVDPTELDETAVNARAHNARLHACVDFLTWCLRRANWTTGVQLEANEEELELRDKRTKRLRDFAEQERLATGFTGSRIPLTNEESDVAALAIGPDAKGVWANDTFCEATRFRNWAMYQTARWIGVRKGEMLKACIEDMPGRTFDVVAGRYRYDSETLRIIRRADDRLDPRSSSTAPHVKRHEREAPAPVEVLDVLYEYIDAYRPATKSHSYIFVSHDGTPLSAERAQQIMRQMSYYACRIYWEVNDPPVSWLLGTPNGAGVGDRKRAMLSDPRHTLGKLSWHRLRHTRAWELFPAYHDVGPTGVDEFLAVFGWRSLRSAAPYLEKLHLKRGTERYKGFGNPRAPLGTRALWTIPAWRDSDDA